MPRRTSLVLVALFTIVGCMDERPYHPVPDDAPDGPFNDARPGIDAGDFFDAGTPIDAPTPVDAPRPDAAPIDAGAIDATPGPTTVSVTVVGSGVVVSSPAGIRCQPTCTATFPRGTAVTLSAIPATGWTFAGWSGGCAGSGPCAGTGDLVVTATFVRAMDSCAIAIQRFGDGTGIVTSSPAGIACGATCLARFPCGTAVVLTASPAAGSSFRGWSGGGCSGLGPCVVVASQPQIVVDAAFIRTP